MRLHRNTFVCLFDISIRSNQKEQLHGLFYHKKSSQYVYLYSYKYATIMLLFLLPLCLALHPSYGPAHREGIKATALKQTSTHVQVEVW